MGESAADFRRYSTSAWCLQSKAPAADLANHMPEGEMVI